MRRKSSTLATAVTVALSTPVMSLAQVDTSNWNCEYCPFDKGYLAEYEAGASHVSDDALRYGNATGYDEKGAYAELGGAGKYASDNMEYSWSARDLGLDTRSLQIAVDRPGLFSVDLGYHAIPYRLFGSTSTVYTIDGGRLHRPSSWTSAATTGAMADLDASLRPVDIGHDRDILELGLSYHPLSNVSLHADYRRQERDGIEIASAGGYTQANFLPRIIDDYTDQVDAGVSFKLEHVVLSLAYYGSFYGNRVDALTWDHLFTPFSSANVGRSATEPDNKFQQFSLSGVYRAGFLDTVLAFSAASGQGVQDMNLLPYTINADVVSPSLPVTAFDGKVDTGNYAFTLTSKPFDKARIKASYRFDERDNQSPVLTWTRVITDTFVTSDNEQNVPWSYQRSRLNVSGTYNLFDTVTVSAGYDRSDLEREFQEVADQTEESTWGKLRWRPTAYLEAVIKGGDAIREIDDYDTTVAASFGQNPLMRKYNLAYRYREFAELTLSASLPERPLSVGMTYLYADDSYTKSELGMTASEERRYTMDFSWAVSDSSTLYLTAGNESIDATQVGSESFTGPAWTAAHEDEFSHVGGGLMLAGLDEKIDLTLDYSHSLGETEILYSGMSVSGADLPDLDSTLDSLKLTLDYAWSDRLSTRFLLRWESFETSDWALDGVLPDTIPSVLSMGAKSYDYDIWAFGVSFRYRVGGDSSD